MIFCTLYFHLSEICLLSPHQSDCPKIALPLFLNSSRYYHRQCIGSAPLLSSLCHLLLFLLVVSLWLLLLRMVFFLLSLLLLVLLIVVFLLLLLRLLLVLVLMWLLVLLLLVVISVGLVLVMVLLLQVFPKQPVNFHNLLFFLSENKFRICISRFFHYPLKKV